MTTTYDYRSGREKTLARAFRIVGAIGAGRTLSAAQTAQGSQILNELIQSWTGNNIFLWSLKNLTTTLVANTITKDLSAANPPVLDIEQAYVLEGTSDYPIAVISWRQYNDIQDKSSTGRPNVVALGAEKIPTLYFHPKPDQSYTINFLASCKLADYDSSIAETDLTEKWERAMAYGVAADLADEYGLPVGEKDRIVGKAAEAFRIAKKLRNRELRDCMFVEGYFK